MLGFLYSFKTDCSEFQYVCRNNLLFVNDSDKICTVDVSQLKNARLFGRMYKNGITKPSLIIHPGKYLYVCLRYASDNLELGHILFYGTDVMEREASINATENKEDLGHWLVGTLDFVIPEHRNMLHILLNNNCLAKFSVNEKLGLVLQKQNAWGSIIIKLMNMLPEYRYTNRHTYSEYTSSLTGEEFPREEVEDGDTRPLYFEPIRDWQMIKQIYEPEEEEKTGGCCTIQ